MDEWSGGGKAGCPTSQRKEEIGRVVEKLVARLDREKRELVGQWKTWLSD